MPGPSLLGHARGHPTLGDQPLLVARVPSSLPAPEMPPTPARCPASASGPAPSCWAPSWSRSLVGLPACGAGRVPGGWRASRGGHACSHVGSHLPAWRSPAPGCSRRPPPGQRGRGPCRGDPPLHLSPVGRRPGRDSGPAQGESRPLRSPGEAEGILGLRGPGLSEGLGPAPLPSPPLPSPPKASAHCHAVLPASRSLLDATSGTRRCWGGGEGRPLGCDAWPCPPRTAGVPTHYSVWPKPCRRRDACTCLPLRGCPRPVSLRLPRPGRPSPRQTERPGPGLPSPPQPRADLAPPGQAHTWVCGSEPPPLPLLKAPGAVVLWPGSPAGPSAASVPGCGGAGAGGALPCAWP